MDICSSSLGAISDLRDDRPTPIKTRYPSHGSTEYRDLLFVLDNVLVVVASQANHLSIKNDCPGHDRHVLAKTSLTLRSWRANG